MAFLFTPSSSSTNNAYRGGAGAQATVWTAAVNDSARYDPEIEKQIRQIKPDMSPFLTLLDGVGNSMPTSQMYFQWLEEWPIEFKVTATDGEAAGVTTLAVNKSSHIPTRAVLFNPATGEQMLVTNGALSSTTVTVIRGIGLSVDQTIDANQTLFITSTAMEEAQDKPELLMRGTDNGTLYTQHIAHASGLADWEAVRAMRGGGEKARLAAQAVEYFKMLREHALMLGVPGRNVVSSLDTYFTAGLYWLAGQWNNYSLGNFITWEGISRAASAIFRYGTSKTRYAFAGEDVIYRIIGLPEVIEPTRRTPGEENLGFNIKTISGPFGTLRLVRHPIMDESGMNDKMIVTDIADLRRRVFSPQQIHQGIEDNGSFRQEWSMEVNEGLEHTYPHAAGVIHDM